VSNKIDVFLKKLNKLQQFSFNSFLLILCYGESHILFLIIK